MENLSLLTKELKENVLNDENLKEATEDLKNSIESDIEGDFKAEKFDELQQNRKTIMMAGVSSARSAISDAKDLMDDVESQESSSNFKQDKRRNTIDAEHYNNVRKAMEKYRFLYTHFAGLFYGENQANDKIMSVVDLQKSRALQKQQLDIIQDQLPNVVENAVSSAVDVEGVRTDLSEEVEKVEEENQRLKDRLQDLEGRISALQRRQDSQGSASNDSSGPSSFSGGVVDDPSSSSERVEVSEEEVEDSEEDRDELSEDQLEILEMVENDWEISEIAEEIEVPEITVETELRKISEQGFEIPDRLGMRP